MIAKMKCSQCGAEMSNMKFSWGGKQWLVLLFTVPLMLVGLYPVMRMSFFKPEVTKELMVSEVSRRQSGQTVDIIGLITKEGKNKWSSVTIKADFFDAAGVFLDTATEYLRSDVLPGTKEHFKISIRSSEPKVQAADTKLVVKVASGMSLPF